MWSKESIELSREYLNYSGVHVKSDKMEFGILEIDYEKKLYTISKLPDLKEKITFNSVEEIIKGGWVVD